MFWSLFCWETVILQMIKAGIASVISSSFFSFYSWCYWSFQVEQLQPQLNIPKNESSTTVYHCAGHAVRVHEFNGNKKYIRMTSTVKKYKKLLFCRNYLPQSIIVQWACFCSKIILLLVWFVYMVLYFLKILFRLFSIKIQHTFRAEISIPAFLNILRFTYYPSWYL